MRGSPSVLTNINQQSFESNPSTDITAANLRQKIIYQQIPVYAAARQYSVPLSQYNRGWVSSDVPTVPGPSYPNPVEAPSIAYANKSYSQLVRAAAQPAKVDNRQPNILTAPPIQTRYGV